MEIAVRSTSRAVTGMRVGTGPLLVSLVAVSSVVHVLAAWLRATPVYFSDEYMYAELGRSFAESGLPLLRGELAPFPALVYPLLTAPAWLLGDVETSWRVLQAFGAVAMSLACIPVFLLAWRLGLSRGLALALGALAIAVPDMVYAGWLLAETVAYPLALAAVAAGVFALASPTRRAQLAFLALAAAATGTRTQFAALFVVYPVAVGILAVAERRFRAVAREQLFPLAAVGIVGVGAFAAGPARVLGMYSSVLTVDVDAGLLVGRIGSNVLVLGYASAWILIPGAILGFGLALARPRTRVERAFAAVTVPFGATLVVEASLFATPEHVQERYAFYALPLLGLVFRCRAIRPGTARRTPRSCSRQAASSSSSATRPELRCSPRRSRVPASSRRSQRRRGQRRGRPSSWRSR
jgi:thiamine transporter ThiT